VCLACYDSWNNCVKYPLVAVVRYSPNINQQSPLSMSSEAVRKKKNLGGTILTILLTLMLPIVLIVLLFLTVPKARHGVFLFALELPGYVTNFILEQYIPIRRFDKALPWLERELRLVNWFASPRNRLLPGLIKNTEYAVSRARFPEEFAVF
jgi:hypothetical protein